MNEKKLTLDEALKVWWFIAWRTFLAGLAARIGLVFLLRLMTPVFQPLMSAMSLIIGLVISIWFIRAAINRDYGTFRLLAQEKNK